MSKINKREPSKTALAATVFRAIANKEFDNGRFGSDDLAELFLPTLLRYSIKKPKSRARIIQKVPSGTYEYFIARTQYFDDLFTDALGRCIPQIVILGAGYDTRAYRFAKLNQKTRIFEVDMPATQSIKTHLLQKNKVALPENVEFITIDFNTDSLEHALAKAGFDIGKLTCFLMEGVAYYLEPESMNNVLESIKRISTKGNLVAFDYIVRPPAGTTDVYFQAKEMDEYMAKSFSHDKAKFFVKEGEITSFLEHRGFRINEHLTSAEIEKKFLVDMDGSQIGRIIGTFRFVSAITVDDVHLERRGIG
jgi:methyltransferase (TIGR00027 family)